MPKVSESIYNFLQARKTPHNADLVDRWSIDCETQINVIAADGERVEGKKSTWSNGTDTWHSIRVPKNAATDPTWSDYEIRYPFDLYAEGIGLTGWNWQDRKSLWVAFDVDSITGHSKGVGISDEALERVKEAAEALPYVEVRKSTGGKGLHFYVYFGGIPTANHTEHAALARCVLGMMSSATGFDFASQIDVCGGIMWVWHRKMTPENQGLTLIKASTQTLTLADLPANWKDHIEVITRKRTKIRINGIENEDNFETLANSRTRVDLDEVHKNIIDELTRSGYSTVWVSDYHLLQTHTKALQDLFENRDLGITGVFKTLSSGKDPATCNCFCFPLANGAWRVYRFSPGAAEDETWEQDGSGWTNCYFNRQPDLHTVAKAAKGTEAPDNGGYVFTGSTEAEQAIQLLGADVSLPEQFKDRETRLRAQKDGRIVVSVSKASVDEIVPQGWLDVKGKLSRVLNIKAEIKAQVAEDSYTDTDKVVRVLISPTFKCAGWVAKNWQGKWIDHPKDNIKDVLANLGMTGPEISRAIGGACNKDWQLVNLPFQPEYPGNREWNRGSVQYKHAPVILINDEVPYHPHWDMVLKHCFQDLDEAIKQNPLAQKANIKCGADYGLLWAACLLRDPFQPLPYLFFYGDEDCGKSTYHEAFTHLISGGRIEANLALTNQSGFNGELAGQILAFIEEIDITKSPVALARIKDWVMSPTLLLRQMRMDAYTMANTLHFIKVSNYQSYCPIFPGDTRITMCYVPPLSQEVKVPRDEMKDALIREAPHFMRTILDLTLPKMSGRLRIPVIDTYHKAQAQATRVTTLDQFLLDICHHVVGERVPFTEFCDRFFEWLPSGEKTEWNKHTIAGQMPAHYPCGIGGENKRWVGNLAWEDKETAPGAKPWVIVNGRLRIL